MQSIQVRKVRYELFTNENFSDNQETIEFRLQMKTKEKTIFDSLLPSMKINEIPDSVHRLVIEQVVPGNDTSTLDVGFVYQIENVGISWYMETFNAIDTFKLLRYSFK